ncbi:MAG: LysR family transcriptional regulator [Peptococcaceae bacterium]|nr:LysR family transcriptional regulator [Peptococcaceae bacterium]
MRIEQLEYLLDIEKTKSITKTAENFFISRQVVSSNIRTLEEELGVQLLIRQQGNLQFTPTGTLAVEKARAVIEAYQDFLHTVSGYSIQEHANVPAPISIYTIPRLASTLIPDIIAQFRSMYPDVNFRIITQPSRENLQAVAETENAIAFISYPDHISNTMEPFQLARFPDLTVTPFIVSQFYICMQKNSRYNTKATFTSGDLTSLPIISFAPAYDVLSNFPDITLNVISDVNNLPTIYSLIKQDLGVGLITLREYTSFNDSKNLILKPLQSNNETLYFAYVLNDSFEKNAYLTAFINLLHGHKM